MFKKLQNIDSRPAPFEFYTADDLWTDEYTSRQMLAYHLDPSTDLASRKAGFIDQSVDWITNRYNLHPGKSVIDFGCGPGLYTNRLAKTGAGITGVDFSGRSIEYAQKTAKEAGLSVDYIHQNYLDFNSPVRFDLILMIFCDFCALSPVQRKVMLAKFANLLNPGGHILLDVCSLWAFEQRKESSTFERNLLNGFWSAREYFGFLHVYKYEDVKVMLDKYTIIEGNRTRTVYNWLQYYSPESIHKEFQENGLKVIGLFGGVAGGDYDPEINEFAVEAQKTR